MNEEFSEKQKHDIDYRRLHDNETQNQRKHIAKFIIFFNVVSVLQHELVEIMRECQITFQCHWIREQY